MFYNKNVIKNEFGIQMCSCLVIVWSSLVDRELKLMVPVRFLMFVLFCCLIGVRTCYFGTEWVGRELEQEY